MARAASGGSLNVPTNCCAGIFKLRVGVKLIGLTCLVDGCWAIIAFVRESIFETEVNLVFGPRGYERLLQVTCAIVGFVSILFGILGIVVTEYQTSQRKLRWISRLKHFIAFRALWTVAWFAAVGVPVEIVYRRVPAVDVPPFSALPGTPHKLIVDPKWPQGKPSVCVDVDRFNQDLTRWASTHRKNRWARIVVRRVVRRLSRRLLNCRRVKAIFIATNVAAVGLWVYLLSVVSYFHNVVKHGGNGVVMIGSLCDLEKPVPESEGFKAMLRHRSVEIFKAIDLDGDGKVSLEEFLTFLEGSHALFAQSDGDK